MSNATDPLTNPCSMIQVELNLQKTLSHSSDNLPDKSNIIQLYELIHFLSKAPFQ